jgi:uncharacterized tellurite resistance protein B-like protein
MGLFDKILGGSSSSALSKPEAFAGVMLAVVAADGNISDEESDAFLGAINRMQMFREQSVADHKAMMNKLFGILRKGDAGHLVTRAAAALTPSLREAAFAAAADLVFVDGNVEDEEREILEKIQRMLEVPDDLAQQIVQVMEIKNRN